MNLHWSIPAVAISRWNPLYLYLAFMLFCFLLQYYTLYLLFALEYLENWRRCYACSLCQYYCHYKIESDLFIRKLVLGIFMTSAIAWLYISKLQSMAKNLHQSIFCNLLSANGIKTTLFGSCRLSNALNRFSIQLFILALLPGSLCGFRSWE